jgi:hypothetical protein
MVALNKKLLALLVVAAGLVCLSAGNLVWSAQPNPTTNADGIVSPSVQVDPQGKALVLGAGTVLDIKSGAYIHDVGFRQRYEFIGCFTALSGITGDVSATPAVCFPGLMKTIVKSAGAPTVNIVAGNYNGVLRLYVPATSEAESVIVGYNNQLCFNVDSGHGGTVFEARVNASVLPTLLTQMAIGLTGTTSGQTGGFVINAGPAQGLCFNVCSGSAPIKQLSIYTKGTNPIESNIDTGITFTAADWLRLRIDVSNSADVQFFVAKSGGAWQRVASTTTFDARTMTTNLQPYLAVTKASGAGLGTLDVDMVDLQQIRR